MQAQQIVESAAFQRITVGVILVSAFLTGLELYLPEHKQIFFWLQKACVAVFCVELALRWLARSSAGEFFRDGWNIFDIIVIVASFLPASGELAPIVRVLRVLRVFRLARNIPELRLIVTVLLRSVVSMKYVALLAGMCFFIFAVAGVKLFGAHRPEFATLHEAAFTLFRVLTGDDWSQLRYEMIEEGEAAGRGTDSVTPFFVLWIIIATFILVNLIVGAIINNYQEVQAAERGKLDPARSLSTPDLDARLLELSAEMHRLMRERSSRPLDQTQPTNPSDRA